MVKHFLVGALFALAVSCAVQAADFSKIPDASKNLKVGQWARYKVMGGIENKQEITAIEGEGDDRVVTLKMDLSMGGNVLQSEEHKMPVKQLPGQDMASREDHEGVEIRDESVTVNGKTYDAVAVVVKNEGNEITTYLSKDVPITGIVKSDITGVGTVMELIDCGEN